MSENSFDVVVIGSGLGGLTAAALLARSGRKVCVIERNHSVGGAASSFRKGALTIEPALHQTADPHWPGDPKHAILTELGILDEIEWVPVTPFYSVAGGPIGEVFDMPASFDAAHQALSERFPRSREGFAQFLGAIERIVDNAGELIEAQATRSIRRLVHGVIEARRLIQDWHMSTADILDRHFGRDEQAKIAVAANVGYYANNPRDLAWPMFAIAQGGFLKSGGRFVKGGSRVLSMKLAKCVMNSGGTVLLGREATEVDLDASGAPSAVRHVDTRSRADEQRVEARQILANCAPHVLAPMLPDAERAKLEAAYGGRPLSTSLFTAHYGLSVDPATIGMTRYGVMIIPDWMTSMVTYGESSRFMAHDPADGAIPGYGFVNYAAIDSGLAGDGPVLVTVTGLDRLENWQHLSPQEDKDRRERWLDAFQADLDRQYPGFSAAVGERMFLNARSMANFMNTPGGAIYGFAPLPFERRFWRGEPLEAKTPLKSIYLASSFTGGFGFSGAMRSGAVAAKAAMAERAR
ncbi:phytoene desaturase family protein [Roseiarcus fermentans]|uniref:phytoene desaturase family protein n=1 Tax=Roseiarcus fermentans TaxID=1473586 RepID=UPI001FE1681B|nr:NAD(P)/FAD-dependent oxidoreductase [Roseiarcus fermentans]